MREVVSSEIPADIVRIRGWLSKLAKAKVRGHPWLVDFQQAVFSDCDLDHALYMEDATLARNALAGIVFRLYGYKPPESVRVSMLMLGVELGE